MSNKFTIYPKLQIGFQSRQGTFTNKLAYIVRANDDGSLREVISWDRWRDKKIDPLFVDNKPLSGFVLNKGHTRYNYSHFGNGKTSVIRVHDPRNFEFEITCENLVFILMHEDCNRRELNGEYVYVFDNRGKVFLLPVSCEEYKNSANFTRVKNTNFSLRDLKVGYTYKTKELKEVIYLGRLRHFEFEPESKKGRFYDQKWIRQGKNKHIFYNGENFVTSEQIKIGECIYQECSLQYAELVEKYQKTSNFNSIKEFKTIEEDLDLKDFEARKTYEYYYTFENNTLYKLGSGWYYCRNDFLTKSSSIINFNLKDGILEFYGSRGRGYSSGNDTQKIPKNDLTILKIHTLYCVMENGEEIKFTNLFKA